MRRPEIPAFSSTLPDRMKNGMASRTNLLLAEEHNEEIRQYVKMINEILEFRYNDIYNP